jgi:uncharacterized protein (TIGR03032 family)
MSSIAGRLRHASAPLAAEDRCHLNGVAVEAGEPRFVTSVSVSDVADGWRDHRVAVGVVVEVASGEVVARGLSMPHSPRLHRGRLYVLDSGSGRFGWIEPGSGRFEEVCFCPGYARGLAFVGEFAVIGLSLPRHNRSFSGLALDDELSRRGAAPRCGLLVVDLRTGDAPHSLRLEGAIQELYDVAAMPGAYVSAWQSLSSAASAPLDCLPSPIERRSAARLSRPRLADRAGTRSQRRWYRRPRPRWRLSSNQLSPQRQRPPARRHLREFATQ